jgi:hypothetical protein
VLVGNRAGLRTSNALSSYSGGARFLSQWDHRLRPEDFFSFSKEMPQ